MRQNRRVWMMGAAAGALAVPASAERVNAIRLKFDIESKVPPAGVLTPQPFPPEVTAALASGALEFRVRYRFPLAERDMLSIQVYLVPPNAPYPLPQLPPATDQSTIAYFEMEVYDLLTVDKPNASVAMAGPIVLTTVSPFGSLNGVLSYLNFQYLPGPPVRFRAVFGGSTGFVSTNAPAGVGTLEWNYRMP